LECREEVLTFLEGRRVFAREEEVSAERGAEECCSGAPIEATAARGDTATPVVRVVLLNPSFRHLLLDALAVLCDWVERAKLSDVAYAAVDRELRYAELRFLETCIEGCSPELATSIASLALGSVESKLRKLFIACGGCMKAINLVAVEGPEARIGAPRCSASYLRPRRVLEILDASEVSHDSGWMNSSCGSARDLASRARGVRRIVREVEAPKGARPPRTFGRFEVMALLQAARYYLLTGDLDKAKSFGLNRAIFYAWAKYYGPRGRGWVAARLASARGAGAGASGAKRAAPLEDEVPVSPRGWFEMDGKEQLPSDFDRQVGLKIEACIPMVVAWRRALAYVRRFPPEVLRDPNKFFKYVYEPVRDSFLERVVANPLHSIPAEVEREVRRVASASRRGSARPPVRRLTDFVSGERGSEGN